MLHKFRGLKFIFSLLAFLLLVGLILSRVYQPEPGIPEPEIKIPAREADDNIGRAAEVCGQVASVKYVDRIKGQPTFVNLESAPPDPVFTAIIWGKNRSKWEESPELLYRGQSVCVTGRIRRHEGTPEIEVQEPSQIRIVASKEE